MLSCNAAFQILIANILILVLYEFEMNSRRNLRKRCGQDCTDHKFIFRKIGNSNKYQVQLLFCPKYQRDPLPAQQTHPVFNKDKKYFTNSFILGVDRRATQENLQHELMNHQKLIKQSLEKNTQIVFPRPNFKLSKQPTCKVCDNTYINYYGHIASQQHRQNIKRNQYNEELLKLCQRFRPLWDGAQQKADLMSDQDSDFDSQNSEEDAQGYQNKSQRVVEWEDISSNKIQARQRKNLQNGSKRKPIFQIISHQKKPNKKQQQISDSENFQESYNHNTPVKRSSTPLLAQLLSKKICQQRTDTVVSVEKKTAQKQYTQPKYVQKNNYATRNLQRKNQNFDNNQQTVVKQQERRYNYQYRPSSSSKTPQNDTEKDFFGRQKQTKQQKQLLPPAEHKKSELKPYHQYIHQMKQKGVPNRSPFPGAKPSSQQMLKSEQTSYQAYKYIPQLTPPFVGTPYHSSPNNAFGMYQQWNYPYYSQPQNYPPTNSTSTPNLSMNHQPIVGNSFSISQGDNAENSRPQRNLYSNPQQNIAKEPPVKNSYVGNTSININFPMYMPYPPMSYSRFPYPTPYPQPHYIQGQYPIQHSPIKEPNNISNSSKSQMHAGNQRSSESPRK